VLLHLPSCCSCAYPSMAASSESGLWATATHRTSGCSAAPLRYFLSQYTLQTPLDGSPGAQANAGFSNKAMSTALAIRRGGGLIRQALTLSLCGSDSDNSNRRESSLCVELRGHAGRLANLDLYSAIWRVAQLPAVRVPLAIATGRRQTVETVRIGAAAIKRNAARGLGAFKTLVSKALHQATLALRPSATLLAFSAGQAMGGHPESPHAPALDLGIDSLHMYTDRSGKCSTGAASLGDGVADGQVLSLLQLVVRSLSNLHEALHHSHYVYFPLSASSFLPLSRAAPLFLGLPLASLGLRAAAHVVARKPIKTGDALAIKVIAATHAAGAALLLLPALAWPLPWPSLPGIAMLPLLLVVQFIWFCIARKASLWADGTAGIPSSDILSAGACTLAAFISSLLVASNIPLAMHAACSLALLAAFALPPPRAFDSELKAAWRPVVVDVLALAISSPAGALFIVSWLWGVPPLLAMGRAGEAFAHRTGETIAAALHNLRTAHHLDRIPSYSEHSDPRCADGLVCVFVCAVYLPFSLCVAAVLLRRFVPSPNELPSGAKRVPRRVRLQCHSPNGTSRYPTRASKRAKNPSKCL